MTNERDARSLIRSLCHCDAGQDVAEAAIILPFLLMIVLGVVELGSVLGAQHSLTGLGREGANIAARGEPLDTVTALMLESGTEIGLAEHGGAVTSRIVIDSGVPRIVAQAASEGFENRSRLGQIDEPASGLSQISTAEGATFHIVELFYVKEKRTPFERMSHASVPDTLYSRAIF